MKMRMRRGKTDDTKELNSIVFRDLRKIGNDIYNLCKHIAGLFFHPMYIIFDREGEQKTIDKYSSGGNTDEQEDVDQSS